MQFISADLYSNGHEFSCNYSEAQQALCPRKARQAERFVSASLVANEKE